MKHLILIVGLMFSFVAAKSQTATTPTPKEKAHTQAMKMQRALGLSDDQTVKAEAVVLVKIEKIAAISKDASKTEEVQSNEIETAKETCDQGLKAIFTPDQYTVYQHKLEAARARKENAH
jgi:hypothetical protein